MTGNARDAHLEIHCSTTILSTAVCKVALGEAAVDIVLPNNKIRLLVGDDFRWIPDGPIERFIQQKAQRDFLNSSFHKVDALRLFMTVTFSKASAEALLRKLEGMASELADLHKQDARVPVREKRHFGVLMAMRPWEFSAFKGLRRPSRRESMRAAE